MAAYSTVQLGSPGSHTVTVPAGVTQVSYLLCGGGAGGNSSVVNGKAYDAGQAGGGGQAISGTVTVTPGQTLTIVVGAGGSAGANGGNSTVSGTGVSLLAYGGYTNGQSRRWNNAGILNTPSNGYGAGTGASSNGAAPGAGQTIVSPDTSSIYVGQGGSPGGGAGTAFTGGGGGSGAAGVNGAGQAGGGGVVYLIYAVDYSAAPLALSTIQSTFSGGTNPIALTEYYAGAANGYVESSTIGYPLNVATLIPSSGRISIGNFEGASPGWILNYTLAAGQHLTNLNIFDLAMASGFPNLSGSNALKLVAYININGILGSTTTGSYAFDTGSGYNKTPKIIVNVGSGGYITGAGAQVTYGNGGPAMHLTTNIKLVNQGIIQGGGGAGGNGSGGMYGGGSGYIPGPGAAGSPYTGNAAGTLDSGGSFQNDDGKAGGANGGAGGGWVSAVNQSPSTDGWGYGSPGTGGSPGTYHGGGSPGSAIVGYAYILAGSTVGTIRGPTS